MFMYVFFISIMLKYVSLHIICIFLSCFIDLIKSKLYAQFISHFARRGGVEVAGWTVDRKTQVRFPAYPHREWVLRWQGV